MTTTLDLPSPPPDALAPDGPLAELAARCRRQRPPYVLLEARFRLAPTASAGLTPEALATVEAACARRLRSRLRSDDEVHALGALAFAVLLRRATPAAADAVAERLQRLCSAPDWLGPQGLLPVLSVRRLVPPEVRGGPPA